MIVDTAGRLAIDEQMMNEIEAIKKAINPDETLFVVDSMTGQDAVNTAREFNERLDFNGDVYKRQAHRQSDLKISKSIRENDLEDTPYR